MLRKICKKLESSRCFLAGYLRGSGSWGVEEGAISTTFVRIRTHTLKLCYLRFTSICKHTWCYVQEPTLVKTGNCAGTLWVCCSRWWSFDMNGRCLCREGRQCMTDMFVLPKSLSTRQNYRLKGHLKWSLQPGRPWCCAAGNTCWKTYGQTDTHRAPWTAKKLLNVVAQGPTFWIILRRFLIHPDTHGNTSNWYVDTLIHI